MSERTDWAAVPMVVVEAPTCPYCRGRRYVSIRSLENGDGSRTKLAVCLACGEAFKIVIEFPESGNAVWPLE